MAAQGAAEQLYQIITAQNQCVLCAVLGDLGCTPFPRALSIHFSLPCSFQAAQGELEQMELPCVFSPSPNPRPAARPLPL